jgi:hypothetical protein
MKHKTTQDEIVAKRLKIEANQIQKVEKTTKAFVVPEIVTKNQMCTVTKPNDFRKLYSTVLGSNFIQIHPIHFMEYLIQHKKLIFGDRLLLNTLINNIRIRLLEDDRASYKLWESNLWIFNMEEQSDKDLPFWSLCLFAKPQDFLFLKEQIDIVEKFVTYEGGRFENFVISRLQRSDQWDHLFVTIFPKLKKRFIKKLAKQYIEKQNSHKLAMKSAYTHMKFKIPISTAVIIDDIKSNSIICNNGIEYKFDEYYNNYFVFTKSNWKLQRDFLPVVTIHRYTSEIIEILMAKMKPDVIALVILFSGLCKLGSIPNLNRREYNGGNRDVDVILLRDYIEPYLFRVNTKQETLNYDTLREFFKPR